MLGLRALTKRNSGVLAIRPRGGLVGILIYREGFFGCLLIV